MLAQRVGLADAVDADDEAEPAGAAGGDAGERVLEHGGLAPGERRGSRAAARNVSGAGLPAQVLPRGDDAVDLRLEEVVDAGRRAAPRGSCALDGDDGAP